jgi:translocation and assembly module TamB
VRLLGKILLRGFAAIAVLLVIGALAGLVVVQSGWFHEYIRKQIVAQLERATGGRVELGRFSFRGATLTAQISPLVLHGKEAEGEPPLLRVESVALSLRVLSFAERKVDLASLRVEKPRVHIVIYPDGSTNLPSPRPQLGSKVWAEDLLNLAVRQYDVTDGLVEVDERRIPLNLHGEGLSLKMTYDSKTPSYHGDLASQRVRILTGELAPMELGVTAQFALEKSRVAFSALRVSAGESRADLTGVLEDLRAPHGNFKMRASGTLRELVKLFPIPLEPTGSVAFDGNVQVNFASGLDLDILGHAQARGIGYAKDRVKISGADVQAGFHLRGDRIALSKIQASALGAQFTGSATLDHWRQFHVEGELNGLNVEQAARVVTDRPMPWNGTLAGAVELDATIGERDAQAKANLAVSPAPQGTPLEGRLDAAYSQSADLITLNSSYLATPASRLEASGALNRRIDVQFRSTNLDDLLPALALMEQDAPKEIPLKLNNGEVTASGTITGTLENPEFRGQAGITNGLIEGHSFDRFAATLDATRATVAATRVTLNRGNTEAAGDARFTARDGKFDDASLAGQFTLRNVNLPEIVKEAGGSLAITGTASATVRAAGSVQQPEADVTLDVQKPAAFGEQADRIRATVHVSRSGLEVTNGNAEDGPGRVQFSGTYKVAGSDWKTGEAQVRVATQNLPSARIEALSAVKPPVEGRLSGDVQAQLRLTNGEFALSSASGSFSAQAVTVDHQPVGEFSLTAETRGADVSITARGKVEDAALEGQGSWRLEGDEPGSATIRFARMDIDSLHRLAMLGGVAPHQDQPDLPLEGFVEGHAAVTLAIRRPRDFHADVTIDAVQFNPKAGQALRLGVQPQDIVLKNSQPVTVAIDSKGASVRSAKFSGRDTEIELAGTIPFTAGGGADLSVQGKLNLIALQLLNPNLLAKGNATVRATLRGSLSDPSLNGTLMLNDASLYMNDVATGLDHTNGAVVFDRRRATIDNKLTAEINGGDVAGTVSFGGFLEFGTVLTYRLQAETKQVRFRGVEDLSVTGEAKLALNGTSDASTLSGAVTLLRAAFTPHADLDQLLAAAARPSATPASPSDYLKGMQFDVQIQSSPDFEMQTSLTRDVEADVELRLRGSPLRPVLLGTISVNQGEIQVFGNKYTIDRGDIRFLNPVKIEPTFDLVLETRAKGVTVNVSFSGNMDKFTTNFSSDPPLQRSEIIALVAVGRDPSQYAGMTSAQTSSSSANFLEAGGGLVSQAVSEQLTSRMQRFFGASHLKVDPTMTGIDNSPQARLTLEQQVSKDISLTYITNLNYTAEQIVRIEWGLNKNWSAIAVRDSNGLFGIDFQYRKRFK